mgnify:CR=1 FL=1
MAWHKDLLFVYSEGGLLCPQWNSDIVSVGNAIFTSFYCNFRYQVESSILLENFVQFSLQRSCDIMTGRFNIQSHFERSWGSFWSIHALVRIHWKLYISLNFLIVLLHVWIWLEVRRDVVNSVDKNVVPETLYNIHQLYVQRKDIVLVVCWNRNFIKIVLSPILLFWH